MSDNFKENRGKDFFCLMLVRTKFNLKKKGCEVKKTHKGHSSYFNLMTHMYLLFS